MQADTKFPIRKGMNQQEKAFQRKYRKFKFEVMDTICLTFYRYTRPPCIEQYYREIEQFEIPADNCKLQLPSYKHPRPGQRALHLPYSDPWPNYCLGRNVKYLEKQ